MSDIALILLPFGIIFLVICLLGIIGRLLDRGMEE